MGNVSFVFPQSTDVTATVGEADGETDGKGVGGTEGATVGDADGDTEGAFVFLRPFPRLVADGANVRAGFLLLVLGAGRVGLRIGVGSAEISIARN